MTNTMQLGPFEVEQAGNEPRLHVEIDGIYILINRTGEGLIIDVMDNSKDETVQIATLAVDNETLFEDEEEKTPPPVLAPAKPDQLISPDLLKTLEKKVCNLLHDAILNLSSEYIYMEGRKLGINDKVLKAVCIDAITIIFDEGFYEEQRLEEDSADGQDLIDPGTFIDNDPDSIVTTIP